MTSCTDKMDNWEVDPSFDRLFATTSITIEPEATQAAITFNTVPNATKYQVQISTDSLSNDVADDASNVTTYELTSSPDTLRDLIGDTYYFLRMRSCSDVKTCSHWIYLKSTSKASFHTKAEQIMNALTDEDRNQESIHVSWTPGAKVTHLIVSAADADDVKIDLDATAVAAGEYTITGLNPSTTYTISIYNGDAKRGTVTGSTNAAAPAGDYTYYMKATDAAITTQFLADIATEAKAAAGSSTNYSATIVVKKGTTVGLYGLNDAGEKTNLVIPDGMSVTFFGEGGGAVPTILMDNQINLKGSHAYVKFQNLNLDGQSTCGYVVNQSEAATVETVTFQDCSVKNFKTSFFRLQGTNAPTIGNVILTNSIFDNLCSGYSFIHVDANSAGVVNNIDIDGCTFSNIATAGKMFIYSKNTNMSGGISIANSTFYNVIGNGNYFIDFGASTIGPANGIKITKCLFGKGADEATNKNTRATEKPVVESSYNTTDWFKVLGTTALEGSSADYFTDPANLNFKLKKATPELCGDPRWYFEE